MSLKMRKSNIYILKMKTEYSENELPERMSLREILSQFHVGHELFPTQKREREKEEFFIQRDVSYYVDKRAV